MGAIGYISEDSFVSAAILSQTPVVNYSPNCLATQCLKRIARTLIRKMAEEVAIKPSIQINYPPPTETIYSTKVTSQKIQERKYEQISTNTLAKDSSDEAKNEEKSGKERPVNALPTSTAFVQNKSEIDPFEMWLSQLSQYFDQGAYTEKTRQYRKRRLIDVLEKLCNENVELLADLESLVVNTSVKDAENILEQTNLTNRLAKTRLVRESVVESNISAPNVFVSGLRRQNVSKAFSIISKLK